MISNSSILGLHCSPVTLILSSRRAASIPACCPFTMATPAFKVLQDLNLRPASSLDSPMSNGKLEPQSITETYWNYPMVDICEKEPWAEIPVCARLMVFALVWQVFALVLRTNFGRFCTIWNDLFLQIVHHMCEFGHVCIIQPKEVS